MRRAVRDRCAGMLVLAITLVGTSCGGSDTVIDLDSGGRTTTSRREGPHQAFATPFRLAAAPVLSPRSNVATYAAFVRYLEVELGRPVELVQRKTYAEINALIRSGGVDLALICGGAYVEARRNFDVHLLAAPLREGEALYYSNLIVPATSRAQSLEDLRGASFAFTDPLSNSGRITPLYELLEMGESPESFFGREVFTYSHDNSIRAVADELVDGAAVDSWVYDSLVAREPGLAARTRVVARWGPFGSPPVVASPGLDPERRDRLTEILLGMVSDSRGRELLASMGIEGFTPADDSMYAEIRRMSDVLGGGHGS